MAKRRLTLSQREIITARVGSGQNLREVASLVRLATPDHPHHRQQIQQTFHARLLRLTYPDATNIEAGAHSVWPAIQTRRRRGGGLVVDLAVGRTPGAVDTHGAQSIYVPRPLVAFLPATHR